MVARTRKILKLTALIAIGALMTASSIRAEVTDSYVPGRFIVKFKSEGPYALEKCADCLINGGEKFRDYLRSHSNSVDQLKRDYRINKSSSLFYKLHNATTDDLKQEQKRFFKNVKKRHANRLKRSQFETIETDLTHVYIMEVPADVDIQEAVRVFNENPHVEFAQPDYVLKTSSVNDPKFQAFDNAYGVNFTWGLERVAAPNAWDYELGQGIVVAVIDTGVDILHEDLAANIWKNADEIPNNGIDDDANGFIDDYDGWNFVEGDNNPMDVNGHGTHVAGIIAAVGNNAIGTVGVAYQSKIMAVRGFDEAGQASSSSVAQAILYAGQNGADVINSSWIASTPVESNPLLEHAIRTVHNLGVVVVVPAGDGVEDVEQFSPQNMDETITVSSIDSSDNPVAANHTGHLIDLAAPGVNIGSTLPGNAYGFLSGTSMAAAHISGAVAIMLVNEPSITNTQVKMALRAAAEKIEGTQISLKTGDGLLNLPNTLGFNEFMTIEIEKPHRHYDVTDFDENINVVGSVTGDSLDGYDIYTRKAVKVDEKYVFSPGSTWIFQDGTSAFVDNHILGVLDASSFFADEVYYVRLTAKNNNGDKFTVIRRIDVKPAVSLNAMPFIEPNPDMSIDEGDIFEFTVMASDDDSSSLQFGLKILTIDGVDLASEVGATIVDQGDGIGTFSWQPTYEHVGMNYFIIEATDGLRTDTDFIRIYVEANPAFNYPPQLNPIADVVMDAGSSTNFTVSATDPDDDPIAITAAPLLSWMSFDGEVMNLNPAHADVGVHTITFTASDGEKTSSLSMTITIVGGNLPPVITPVGDILLVEKDKVSVSINVSDPEGDPLNISISPLESWMSLNGRDLVLKPLVGDAGSYALTLTVSDGQNSATEIINVIVEPIPNNAPVLNITNYKKVIVEKGQKSVKFSIDFDVSDPDGDRVRTSVNDLPRFAKLKRSSIDFTVSDKNVGIYNFSVTATDALGAATTEDVTVEVVLAAKNSKVTLSNTITVLQKWQSLDKRQKKEAVNNLVKQLKRNLRKK